MTPEQLSATIVDGLSALVDQGALTLPDGVPTEVTVERPRQKGHGDYATNVALQLAKKSGMNPRQFGELLAAQLEKADGIAAVEIAGPGFLNITVEAGAQGELAAEIVAAGATYGSSNAFAGEKINLEFVSANPTGPLHIGGVRWAAVGDALGRIFTMTGAEVTGSTTSTTTAPRSIGSPGPCWRARRASPRRRTATAATTSTRSLRPSSRIGQRC